MKTWDKPCFAISVERNINLVIEYQCPQCGAPVVLDETDRLFSCGFCKVRSYLVPGDIFRYRFPDKAPGDKEIIYFPYWRFKGSMYSLMAQGIHNRYVDMSHRAVDSDFFPSSVGLRSQALKLKFVSPKDQGRFLKPTLSIQSVMTLFEERFQSESPDPVFLRHYVGETLSVIYSPFYVDQRLYDAVLNEPLNNELPANFNGTQFAGGPPNWKMDFLPTLCPACGWNLEGEKDALVLICQNCRSAWKPGPKGFSGLNIAHIPAGEQPVTFFPFWRIKAEIPGVQLKTYADLIKIANLPKVSRKSWDQIEFHFWVTAFKMRPQRFLTVATNLTLAQPQDELTADLPEKNIFSVTLSLSQAVNSLKLILANFVKPPKMAHSVLKDMSITPKSYLLVYVPFKEKPHDFIHLKYPIAISKNQMAFAGDL